MLPAMHFAAEPTSAVGTGAESLVSHLLVQLIVIIVVTRLVVLVVRRLWQTDVSGEILAGLLLGPSLLGALAPGLMHDVFNPSTAAVLSALAQLGLVLLMFQIGLEFEFGSVFRSGKRTILLVSTAGITMPFAAGILTAPFFYDHLPGSTRPDELAFRLFFAVAMSITAIPILGRIFLELGLSHTRVAALTIGSASIDDVVGWLLLGSISLIVVGDFSGLWLVWHVLALAGYLAVIFLIVRPLLGGYLRRVMRKHGGLTRSAVPVVLAALFASALTTSSLDVFAIIGGFTVGVALHEERAFVAEWRRRVSPLVYALLLPIFFAVTGLRTDIGTLGSIGEIGILLLVLLVAFGSKIGGALLGARLAGESRRDAATIAVCMNTRALMELIALNIGLELGVLPPSMFTKLVLMAIISTFLATPMIRYLMRDQQRPTTETFDERPELATRQA